jgi:hypothetical protein
MQAYVMMSIPPDEVLLLLLARSHCKPELWLLLNHHTQDFREIYAI